MAQRTICFLVLPHVHLMDLSGPAQVFFEASALGQDQYRLIYAGVSDKESSEQGLTLGNLQPLKDISLNAGDFVFVPGIDFKSFAAGAHTNSIRKIAPWLKAQKSKGVFLASICSGSLILAAAGLLDGVQCTTHWKCVDYMKTHYPKTDVLTDQLYVKDNQVYTSAGMTSGIDMALSIIEHYQGPVISAKVAREMVVYIRRNNTDRQQTIYLDYQTHFNPAVHKVQDYIISNPDRNPGLEELAALCHLSVRNLTRLFRLATGHTIVDFKRAVKLELARTLLNNPEYTVEKVASLCGFQSGRHLRRVWKSETGEALRGHIAHKA
ncbi:MAG TPA: DJ-1/PfpI family protein [Cyclobacteriaceae bacterium]|nr:DJ-1/PfpI family protein [Cyclobacteriaceae bacterium]